jgi:hypothetical protein
MNEWTRYLQLLGRTLIGIIFLWGGVAKAMSFDELPHTLLRQVFLFQA